MGIEDWDKHLCETGPKAIDRATDLVAGTCLAMIGNQSTIARTDGADVIDTTRRSATRDQLDHAAERSGLALHWHDSQSTHVDIIDDIGFLLASMVIVERVAGVGRYGNDTVTANLQAGRTEPEVLLTDPGFFAPRDVDISPELAALRGTKITDPVSNETGEFNPLGAAGHLLDNAAHVVLQDGHRLPADKDDPPPWWFYPAAGIEDVSWIGYRFDNRLDGGRLQVVAELNGAQHATNDQDTYDWSNATTALAAT